MKKLALIISLFMAWQTPAFSQDKAVTIEGAWARPILIAGRPGGAYLKAENSGSEADKILSATSNISSRVELHEHTMTDGVMKMGQVPYIEVPAGGSVELKPGGFHIMLFETDGKYGPGDEIKIELTLEKAGKIELTVPVLKRAR